VVSGRALAAHKATEKVGGGSDNSEQVGAQQSHVDLTNIANYKKMHYKYERPVKQLNQNWLFIWQLLVSLVPEGSSTIGGDELWLAEQIGVEHNFFEFKIGKNLAEFGSISREIKSKTGEKTWKI